jgi:hypothetical protein
MTTSVMVSTVIGKGLLAGALGDLYLFIKSSAYNEHLEQVLRELDIKAELDVVQALLDDLANHTECRVVKVSSDQMKASVDLIHNELKEIQRELEYHKTRYLCQYRTPNYEPNLKKLRQHRDILRKRRELLIAALSVQRNLQLRRNNVVRNVLSPTSAPVTMDANKPSFIERTCERLMNLDRN